MYHSSIALRKYDECAMRINHCWSINGILQLLTVEIFKLNCKNKWVTASEQKTLNKKHHKFREKALQQSNRLHYNCSHTHSPE